MVKRLIGSATKGESARHGFGGASGLILSYRLNGEQGPGIRMRSYQVHDAIRPASAGARAMAASTGCAV